ncbi:MAG: hypothetical protein Fur0018_08380 [Anaerolineales bacterium]
MRQLPRQHKCIFIVGSLFFTAVFFISLSTAQGVYRLYLPLVLRRDPPPPLLITEVLFDPAGDEPAGEWVELYNPYTTPLDLSAYKLGDAESAGKGEGMYQFPPGAQLAPQSAIVIANNAAAFHTVYGRWPDYECNESDPFVPTMRKYLWWASGNINLSNTGDEILLLDENDQPADALSWGNSQVFLDPSAARPPEGSSLERYPALEDNNTAADWRAQPQPNPGLVDPRYPTATPWPTATATPATGRVLLSEVYLHPPADEPAAEWLELYNPETYPVTLAGLKLGDEETPGGGEGMYAFPAGSLIPPQSAVVVAVQGAVFSATWGFAPDYELVDTLPGVSDLAKYAPWASGSFNLSNSGDEVLLLAWDDNVLDAVSWGNSTFAFDPALPAPSAGESLERYPPAADTDTAADWRLQGNPDPGGVDTTAPTATPVPTQTATPGTPTVTPTPTATPAPAGHLLITAVLYDPVESEPAGEWFVLHNPLTVSVALDGYKMGDEEQAGGSEGMYAFPVSSTLPAGGYAVIAHDGAVFSATWGFAPDYELVDSLPDVPDLQKYTPWSGGSVQLGNSGDEALLLGPGDVLVDALSWGNSAFAFDPPCPDVPEGHSLERYPPDVDSDTAADWRDQPAPQPR